MTAIYQQQWRNPDVDKEQRKLIFKQTMKCIHNELKLELAARRYEKLLYLNAGSMDEYSDLDTIRERVHHLLSSDSPSVLVHDLFSLPPLSLEQQIEPLAAPTQQRQQKDEKEHHDSNPISDSQQNLSVEPLRNPLSFSPTSNLTDIPQQTSIVPSPNHTTNSSQQIIAWDDASPIRFTDDPSNDETTSRVVSTRIEPIPEESEADHDVSTRGTGGSNPLSVKAHEVAQPSDVNATTLRFITSSRANRRRVDWMGRPHGTLLAPILKHSTIPTDGTHTETSMSPGYQRRSVAFYDEGPGQQPLVYTTYDAYDEIIQENMRMEGNVPFAADSHETSYAFPSDSTQIWTRPKRTRQENQVNYAATLSPTLVDRKRERLLELHHAAHCMHDEQLTGRVCPSSSRCAAMKELWSHLSDCSNKRCRYPHCCSSRTVLSHFRSCRAPSCPVCIPVQNRIAKLGTNEGLTAEITTSPGSDDNFAFPSEPVNSENYVEWSILSSDNVANIHEITEADKEMYPHSLGYFSESIVFEHASTLSPSTRPSKKSHAVHSHPSIMLPPPSPVATNEGSLRIHSTE